MLLVRAFPTPHLPFVQPIFQFSYPVKFYLMEYYFKEDATSAIRSNIIYKLFYKFASFLSHYLLLYPCGRPSEMEVGSVISQDPLRIVVRE